MSRPCSPFFVNPTASFHHLLAPTLTPSRRTSFNTRRRGLKSPSCLIETYIRRLLHLLRDRERTRTPGSLPQSWHSPHAQMRRLSPVLLSMKVQLLALSGRGSVT